MWSMKASSKFRPSMLFGCGITLVAVMAALVEIHDSRMPRGWHQRNSFFGHTSPIMVVTFSPDGQLLASGDFDGNLLSGIGRAVNNGHPLPSIPIAFFRCRFRQMAGVWHAAGRKAVCNCGTSPKAKRSERSLATMPVSWASASLPMAGLWRRAVPTASLNCGTSTPARSALPG